MKISLGIVGLPNVGKSTLFNTLTNASIPAENYPFCTIDPNVGIVPVADSRLDEIAKICSPEKVTPAVIEFWDIAGLVRGANKGEGLGNQFLANIREVAAIVHVVRTFGDKNILHVEESVDARRDIEIINTELILKDIATLQNRLRSLERDAKKNPKLLDAFKHLEALNQELDKGILAKNFLYDGDNQEIISARKELQLITDKPVLYLVNTEAENKDKALAEVRSIVGEDENILALDVKLESELMQMSTEERTEFRESYGIERSGLEELTLSAYALLGLISYFTEGKEEARAWTIEKGTKAPQAAGAIHTDFIKKFVTAEIVSYADYIASGSWEAAKKNGKLRIEGKEYVVQDGDIIFFRING